MVCFGLNEVNKIKGICNINKIKLKVLILLKKMLSIGKILFLLIEYKSWMENCRIDKYLKFLC